MIRTPAALAILLLASRASGQEATPPGAPEGAAAEEVAEALPLLPTSVDAVTVYSDQARVTRAGAADVLAGVTRIEVAGLPAALEDATVRARVVSGAARLLNLEVLLRNRTTFKKKEAEEAEQRLREVQGRRRAAEDRHQTLERQAAFLRELDVGRRPAGRPEAPQPAPIAVGPWSEALQFLAAALTANRASAREALAEIDGIDEELQVAMAEAQRLASAKTIADKSVIVELEAAAPAAVRVEVAYIVKGPGWWPRYDVRAEVDSGKVELTSFALVRQETGEDWTGAELTFSAAEPARAVDVPELLAVRIGEAGPARASGEVASSFAGKSPVETSGAQQEGQVQLAQGPSSASTRALFGSSSGLQSEAFQYNQQLQQLQAQNQAQQSVGQKGARIRQALGRIEELRGRNDDAEQRKDWDAYASGNRALEQEILLLDAKNQQYFAKDLMACATNIVKAERLIKSAKLAEGVVAPATSSRGYDYRYRAARRETVPSDGAFNKVVIAVEEFPARFVYETAPLEQTVAFLTTQIRNERRQPYLEGPASVFLGADFVGDGHVPTTSRGEEFTVSLGADESVKVTRHAEQKRENTGFFTSYHLYRYTVEVRVRNGKSRPVKVSLLDLVPFSDDEGVTVRKGEMKPAPAKEDKLGLCRWDLEVRPGGEQVVRFEYSVELRADRQVVASAEESLQW